MNKPEKYKDWLTQHEAAIAAGVKTTTINYHVTNGNVVAVKHNRQWLIDPASLKKIYPDMEV